SLGLSGPGEGLQQCCDCCGLGLRVRAEGQSCESNPNLGYPCNHVMLSCCEGEDPLIVPEVRRPPEPEAVPRRGGCCSPSQAWGPPPPILWSIFLPLIPSSFHPPTPPSIHQDK
ncbi:hypothetical protein FD755_024663, partial [Muntiacus reevesi]